MSTHDSSAGAAAGERVIRDFQEILDAQFRAGRGALLIEPSMSDSVIVQAIRAGMSHGVPFVVNPRGKVRCTFLDELDYGTPNPMSGEELDPDVGRPSKMPPDQEVIRGERVTQSLQVAEDQAFDLLRELVTAARNGKLLGPILADAVNEMLRGSELPAAAPCAAQAGVESRADDYTPHDLALARMCERAR